MKLLGFNIPFTTNQKQVPSVSWSGGDRGWYPIVNEPYTGAWQRNDGEPFDSVMSHYAVYRCVTLIASDVAKMRVKLVKKDADGIWQETDSSAFTPVLRKPNDYQTRIQFYQQWMMSKLSSGNTYVLKGRDDRNIVNALYVLDPYRVKPLVAPDGAVFYQLYKDDLAGQFVENLVLPASEIIHDRMNPLFHPLCGLSPIYANYLPAMQGLRIQRFSDRFFKNHARPSGLLTAPGDIPQATADRIKSQWENNYSGENLGKVAVAGSGLTWVPMVMNAVDAQLVDQLKLTAEQVCTTYGVPGFKAGVGSVPNVGSNAQVQNQIYYNDCVQIHVESIEILLDEGLGLTSGGYGSEFDLDNLLRMDSATLTNVLGEQVNKGILAPNEARAVLGYSPVKGGDTPYLQQQNFSLAALDKRDSLDNPFETSAKTSTTTSTPAPAAPANDNADAAAKAVARAMLWDIRETLNNA